MKSITLQNSLVKAPLSFINPNDIIFNVESINNNKLTVNSI